MCVSIFEVGRILTKMLWCSAATLKCNGCGFESLLAVYKILLEAVHMNLACWPCLDKAKASVHFKGMWHLNVNTEREGQCEGTYTGGKNFS